MHRCTKEELTGGTPEENAAITRAILQGERGPKRDAVLMNAGASLYIGGKAESMKDGVRPGGGAHRLRERPHETLYWNG